MLAKAAMFITKVKSITSCTRRITAVKFTELLLTPGVCYSRILILLKPWFHSDFQAPWTWWCQTSHCGPRGHLPVQRIVWNTVTSHHFLWLIPTRMEPTRSCMVFHMHGYMHTSLSTPPANWPGNITDSLDKLKDHLCHKNNMRNLTNYNRMPIRSKVLSLSNIKFTGKKKKTEKVDNLRRKEETRRIWKVNPATRHTIPCALRVYMEYL